MRNLDAGIFKAYDVRGIYPEQLNEEIAHKLGNAFVQFLNCRNVAVGRDMRLSSGALFKALCKGITGSGADVIDLGLCSTDMFYFAVEKYGYDSGIMITASHNPKEWNGFKLTRGHAIPIGDNNGLMEIRDIIAKNKSGKSNKKGSVLKKDFMDEFAKFCINFVDASRIKPLKVVMDACNGMAGMVAPKIFSHTKIKIVPMYFKLDGSFPNHQSNPLIEENRQEIMQRVLKESADLGIAWDGDADRCFFIDDEGRFVPGDFITGLLARETLKKMPGAKIFYDLRASRFVKDIIEKNSGEPRMCRVGHAFFKQHMREENGEFAGEVSGHYYYHSGNLFADNGMIPALQMLQLISEGGKKLSEILKETDNYHISGEINLTVKDKDAVLERIESYHKDAKNIYHIDGLSAEYGDWRFNLRKSNTEQLIRLNLEADTEEKMLDMKEALLKEIKEVDS